jgi:hypothetical protein
LTAASLCRSCAAAGHWTPFSSAPRPTVPLIPLSLFSGLGRNYRRIPHPPSTPLSPRNLSSPAAQNRSASAYCPRASAVSHRRPPSSPILEPYSTATSTSRVSAAPWPSFTFFLSVSPPPPFPGAVGLSLRRRRPSEPPLELGHCRCHRGTASLRQLHMVSHRPSHLTWCHPTSALVPFDKTWSPAGRHSVISGRATASCSDRARTTPRGRDDWAELVAGPRHPVEAVGRIRPTAVHRLFLF